MKPNGRSPEAGSEALSPGSGSSRVPAVCLRRVVKAQASGVGVQGFCLEPEPDVVVASGVGTRLPFSGEVVSLAKMVSCFWIA